MTGVENISFAEDISKKSFRPCGIAPSEWRPWFKLVRDIPVENYSPPCLSTTCQITYRSRIVVSLFLLGLLVSYHKRTLWCCGQLWPYVGMGSLGALLNPDCNAMRDVATISLCILSTCVQSANLSVLLIQIISSGQIHVTIGNPSLIPFVFCVTANGCV